MERTALAPAFSANSARWTASRVELEPAPAMTGTRPPDASTASSMTRRCSSWLTVGDSPVVPTGTSPLEPSSICHLTKRTNAFSSMAPLWNGVINAGIDPLNIIVPQLSPAGAPGGCFTAFCSTARADCKPGAEWSRTLVSVLRHDKHKKRGKRQGPEAFAPLLRACTDMISRRMLSFLRNRDKIEDHLPFAAMPVRM